MIFWIFLVLIFSLIINDFRDPNVEAAAKKEMEDEAAELEAAEEDDDDEEEEEQTEA